MLDRIQAIPELKSCFKEICQDENDKLSITIDNQLHPNNYLIINLTEYYTSLKLKDQPKTPDCFIIQRCANGSYSLTIIEFKQARHGASIKKEEIQEKLETCFDDFILRKFKSYLNISYTKIDLYLISNRASEKRDSGLSLKILFGVKINFNGKTLAVQPKSQLTLTPC